MSRIPSRFLTKLPWNLSRREWARWEGGGVFASRGPISSIFHEMPETHQNLTKHEHITRLQKNLTRRIHTPSSWALTVVCKAWKFHKINRKNALSGTSQMAKPLSWLFFEISKQFLKERRVVLGIYIIFFAATSTSRDTVFLPFCVFWAKNRPPAPLFSPIMAPEHQKQKSILTGPQKNMRVCSRTLSN